jgi:hypothetical protein
MRKISLILVVFVLASPALARVDIIVDRNEVDPFSFDIRYNITPDEPNVRAFALDIFVDNDIKIIEVNDFHVGESNSVTPGYGIFPHNFAAKIDPENPDWDADGYTPLADSNDYPDDTLVGLDTNGITVELASLYVGEVNAPALSGVLLEITVEQTASFPNVNLALNQIRGGVVLEDPDTEVSEVNMVSNPDCLIGGNAGPTEHSTWVSWDRPACWCYCRQCRGDVDGKATFGKFVAIADLGVLYAAYNKSDAVLATIPNGICADFDHKATFGIRVAISDLGIAYQYYNEPSGNIPQCDTPTVITGPYNFWVIPTGGSCP